MHETRPRGDAPGVPCRAEIRCWKAWVGGWVGGWIHLGSGRRCDNIHTATLKSLLRPHFRPIYCARRHTGYGFCLSSHLALTVRCVCACGPQRVVAARAHQHAAGGAASVWAIQRPTVNPGTGAGDGGGSAWGGAKRRGLVSCRAAETPLESGGRTWDDRRWPGPGQISRLSWRAPCTSSGAIARPRRTPS